MQRAAPLCASQISSDFFASPFKKLAPPPFLLIACYSGLMVALPHVFGITFVLVARVGAAKPLAAFKQPAPLLAVVFSIC